MQTTGQGTPERQTGAVILVSVLIAAYLTSQFFRNAITVIAPDLAREFALDATQLSLLASAFYLSFALFQIPLGMAIDRFGPRSAMLVTSLVLIAGTVWFVFARDFNDLVGARLVIGIGCSSFLMAPLAIYAQRFPPGRFATMAGIHVGAGNFGTIIATAPLAYGAATYGWRHSFLAVAAFVCVATVLVWLFVREASSARAARVARAETFRQSLAGLIAATKIRWFWSIFLVSAMTYPSFAAILALWAGPWMAHVYGLPLEARGNYLFAMALAQIAGLFAWASTDRLFRSYRIPVALGSILGASALALPAVIALPLPWLLPYLIGCGFIFGYSPLLTAHGRALFPPELLGRGLSLLNIGAIGGVFVQQMLTGFVMSMFESTIVGGARVYPEVAYRTAFGVLALEVFVALLIYVRVSDLHPDRKR